MGNLFKDLEMDRDTGFVLYLWLLCAVLSLVFAGIFAFLVAMARTPVIKDIMPGSDYFYIALIAHVNLSVTIWFLSFMSVLWIFSSTTVLHTRIYSSMLGKLGVFASVIGAGLVIITALLGWGRPYLSNYIPLLRHPLFYAGLIIFGLSISVTIINSILSVRKGMKDNKYSRHLPLITYGMLLVSFIVLIAITCFILAYIFISREPFREDLLERLFWGGGHILQFANTTTMIIAWIILSRLTVISKGNLIGDRTARILLGLLFIFTLPGPMIYFLYDINSQAYKDIFTRIMQLGLGLSPGIFALLIVGSLLSGRGDKGIDIVKKIQGLPWKDYSFSSLILSLLLFGIGGAMSLMIHGSNVKIPSHYHGVIGAVTIAFMGVAYNMLPVLKRNIYSKKTAAVQPYLYGIGQIIFVLGMFLAGTEGVPRKTFGSAEVLTSFLQYAGMAIVGIGGIVAIIGGAAFVINMLVSLLAVSSEGELAVSPHGSKIIGV